MKFSTDLRAVGLIESADHILDDVAWLDAELADAVPGRESRLAQLLLSRIAFNHTLQFCALLDPTGIVWDVNSAALRSVGLTRGEVRGQPLWEARWWQDSAEAREQIKAAIELAAGGESVRYDADIIGRTDGQLIAVDFSVQPVKDRDGIVRLLICEGFDVTERRQRVEAAMRESEERLEATVAQRTKQLLASNAKLLVEAEQREKAEGRFKLLVEGVVDYAIYMLDPTGVITNWNAGAERIKGYSSHEIIGQHFSRFFSDADRAADVPGKALRTAQAEGKYEAEGWRMRKDGTPFWASVLIDPLRDKSGVLLGFAKITRDITERREAAIALERTREQLAQAQKMEGIGHLTGGVAHDFNNLLAIIMGNLETLQRVLQQPGVDADRLRSLADNAMGGAQRAASLTQRLLAFSRQQPLDPKVIDVSKLVVGMSDLLARSLGEQIVVETVLAAGLWPAHVDPNQLEVAILNLALNARDAMSQGGKLTIETANAYLDETYAATQAELISGQYIVISVADNGCGMTQQVAARAFEPFYTTKDAGHGTGLGLSQVYGFVKQSGGHLRLYTDVGKGTMVKIYLPRLPAGHESAEVSVVVSTPARGDSFETVLVVEDEDNVRAYTTEILRELGYRAYQANTGAAALRLLQSHPEVQLLFTDVGLPGGMNGRQLAQEACARHRGLKVLFTTAYAQQAIVHDGRLDPGVQLITKPYTYAALASKLREVLDAVSRPGRVLLVEDEDLVQLIAVDQLTEIGYAVELAGSAAEALDKLRSIGKGIDAAIIDFGLPDRMGDVLVAEIREIYPSLPIVVVSGYGEALRTRFDPDDDGIAFLSKPYTIEQLRSAIVSLVN